MLKIGSLMFTNSHNLYPINEPHFELLSLIKLTICLSDKLVFCPTNIRQINLIRKQKRQKNCTDPVNSSMKLL